jgi:hypothetical protein
MDELSKTPREMAKAIRQNKRDRKKEREDGYCAACQSTRIRKRVKGCGVMGCPLQFGDT